MRDRGYPLDDVENRADLVATDHAELAGHYRAAHEVGQRADDASTEELRRAFVHYRALFVELLAEPQAARARAARPHRARARPGRPRPPEPPTLGRVRPLVVGFDLDMTLIDTRPGIAAVWDALSAETGVPIDSAAAVSRLGPPLSEELALWFPGGPGRRRR